MKAKYKMLLLTAMASIGLVSCGGGAQDDGTIRLKVWAGSSQDSLTYIHSVIEKYKAANPDKKFEFTVDSVSEQKVNGKWGDDPSEAADVAIAADDQLPQMVSSQRVLHLEAANTAIPGIKDRITESTLEDAMEVVTRQDPVSHEELTWGIPVSASNGFVLYYNAKYLQPQDVTTFDNMLAAIHRESEKAGRNLTFGYPYHSGWYLDGWFHGAGFRVNGEPGELTVDCDWNTTKNGIQGKDVAGAMIKLAHGQHKEHWSADSGENIVPSRIQDGVMNEVVATISGTWVYNDVVAAWGNNTKATVLPTYHLDLANTDKPMHAIKGFKVAIINRNRDNMVEATKFAEFMVNKENQVARYHAVNEAPANIEARAETINENSNPVVKAIQDMWSTSFVEKVNPSYWNAAESLCDQLCIANEDTAKYVTSGEGTADIVLNYDEIQARLDTAVNVLAGNK